MNAATKLPGRWLAAVISLIAIATLVAVYHYTGGSPTSPELMLTGSKRQAIESRRPVEVESVSLQELAPTLPNSEASKEGVFGLRIPDSLTRLSLVSKIPGPLDSSYAEFAERAILGDAQAALKLGVSLAACDSAPHSPKELSELILHIQSTETLPGNSTRLWNPIETVRKLRESYTYCKGIPPELIPEYASWLKLAADHGDLQAQTFLMEMLDVSAETWKSAKSRVWKSEEEYLAYRARLLMEASARGSTFAMIRLSGFIYANRLPEMTYHQASILYIAGVAAEAAAGYTSDIAMSRANYILDNASESERKLILDKSQKLLDGSCCVIFDPQ